MWNIAIINAITNEGKTHMPSIVILLTFSAFLILVKGITSNRLQSLWCYLESITLSPVNLLPLVASNIWRMFNGKLALLSPVLLFQAYFQRRCRSLFLRHLQTRG